MLTLTATPIPRTLHMAMSGRARHEHHRHAAAGPPGHPHLRHEVRSAARSARRSCARSSAAGRSSSSTTASQSHPLDGAAPPASWCPRSTHRRGARADARGPAGEGDGWTSSSGSYQVLLCTTIIESGIDIASRQHDDRQPRRHLRAGAALPAARAAWAARKERAYAYLLVPARRAVTKDAQRRLEVLQAFTELGAGFSIASHDLEIRGAGNLLGARAVGRDRGDRLRSVRAAARGGGAPRCAASRRAREVEPEVTLPLAGAHARRLRARRAPAAGASTSASPAPARPDELTTCAPSWWTASARRRTRWTTSRELMLLKMEMRELRLRGAGERARAGSW